MTDTPDRVRKIIADHLAQWIDGTSKPLDFEWSGDLRRVLNADSLDIVELTIALEDEFDIQIDDDSAFRWRTAGDMLATVQGLVTVEPADHFAGAGKMVGDDEIGGAIDV